MKKLAFLLFLLFAPFSQAAAIALSPNELNIHQLDKSYSFILLNPNNEPVNYKIISSSNNIKIAQSAGLLNPNEKQEIKFNVMAPLEKEEFITTVFVSSNSINPTLSLKLSQNSGISEQPYSEKAATRQQIQTNTIQTNTIQKTSENNQITSNAVLAKKSKMSTASTANKSFFDETTIYLLLSITILVYVLATCKTYSKKHRIGHTGQKLRMFIKKFTH